MMSLRTVLMLLTISTTLHMQAQSSGPYVRIARLVIDSAQLKAYQAALKEEIAAAVKAEPGVLRMYAVYDKVHPDQVTVFETYASREAYDQHIQTPHFKKYKAGTLSMVRSLELADVVPIIFEAKKDQ
jgi:quinol monooxygenase YgiN